MDLNWQMKEANRRARVSLTKDALGKMKLSASRGNEEQLSSWAGFFLTSLAARVAEGTTVEELVTALELPDA